MAIFKGKNQATLSQREKLELSYNNARRDVLALVVLSLFNIILLLTNSNTYFLVSAYIPYMLVFYGMFFTGKLPTEDYEYYYGVSADELNFFNDAVFYILMAIAVIILALYFLCFLFSKNGKYGWLIAAAAIFTPDVLFVIFGGGDIVDIIFHIAILGIAIYGIVCGVKLKKLPVDDTLTRDDGSVFEQWTADSENLTEPQSDDTDAAETENEAVQDGKPDGSVDF